MSMECGVCFRHCRLEEGESGFCGGRVRKGNRILAGNYGKVTALALDPIEKKPLARFHPGSLILSVGSYGCNLRCPFCQNHSISWSEEALRLGEHARTITPEALAETARTWRGKGNLGVAFTYNEPLIGWEFVQDTAKLVRREGMKNVMVTNGTAELEVLEELLPWIDAMNIDLKGFTDRYYSQVLGGDRTMVMDFIRRAVSGCHVELTTLIVPGENDTEEEMEQLSRWVAGLTDGEGRVIGEDIPLHISRFFPRFHREDREATDVGKVYRLTEVARQNLHYVYTGNC
ncbi:MAG: AmmeMemoRadiSam system radical SAM enzyme [Firmicutes bacterium]|nr:AmmeMemoRadiSam system radical SAM enzyme [Bacillota bacterium]